MNFSSLNPLTVQVLTITRSDRWQVYQRLQELGISCHCLEDGYLAVEVESPVAVLQLRSVVQQLTASRAELLDWLKHCWQVAN